MENQFQTKSGLPGEGVYVAFPGHIAFRDNHMNEWRLSQVEVIGTNQLTLTHIKSFTYIYEVYEYLNSI